MGSDIGTGTTSQNSMSTGGENGNKNRSAVNNPITSTFSKSKNKCKIKKTREDIQDKYPVDAWMRI